MTVVALVFVPHSPVVSVTTIFMMSEEPLRTCTSKLHGQTSFRIRQLYQHSHFCTSIKLLSPRNLRCLPNCTNGWCLLLYHSSDINDPISVLDLRDPHGSSFCTSGSRASVVPHTRAVVTCCFTLPGPPTILSMYCISLGLGAGTSQRAYPPFRSRTALLGVGHCFCTTVCRASPRHELRLLYLVSFRDARHLYLSHSAYDLNSPRDLRDGRQSFLYSWFFSLNCTCLVSTAFWNFSCCSAPGNGAVGYTFGVFATPTNCQNLNLMHLHCSLLCLDCWNFFA